MARRKFFEDEEMQEVNAKTLWRLLRYLSPHKGVILCSIALLLLAGIAAQRPRVDLDPTTGAIPHATAHRPAPLLRVSREQGGECLLGRVLAGQTEHE